MKLLTLLIVLCIFMSGVAVAEDLDFGMGGENVGTEFEWINDDIPEICFFPEDKARWNGSEVTGNDWLCLIEYQMGMFISEYIEQLEKLYRTPINIKVDDYVMGMSSFVYMNEEKAEEALMVDVLNDLLNSQAAIVGVQLTE